MLECEVNERQRRELVAEMKKYRLEVLGVSETKVRGNGVKQIGDVVCVCILVCRKEGRNEGWRFSCR